MCLNWKCMNLSIFCQVANERKSIYGINMNDNTCTSYLFTFFSKLNNFLNQITENKNDSIWIDFMITPPLDFSHTHNVHRWQNACVNLLTPEVTVDSDGIKFHTSIRINPVVPWKNTNQYNCKMYLLWLI